MLNFWKFPSPVFGLLKKEGKVQSSIIIMVVVIVVVVIIIA